MPIPFLEQEKIKKFQELLEHTKEAVVVTHVNPDGDAIGTSLALKNCLEHMGISVTVIVPNPFPEFLHWLDGVDEILIYKHSQTKAKKLLSAADLLFCVDLNSLTRLDEFGDYIFDLLTPRVLIDHHLQPALEEFAVSFSRTEACSSAEILYHLVSQMGILSQLSMPAAEAIYTGILTDTNGFQNNCTRPEVFCIIAELLRHGVDKEKVFCAVYNNYSEQRMHLLGYALYEKMVVLPEYRTAYIALSREEMERFHFQPGDTEGFVNYPLGIKNIVFSAFISENADNIRMSFRSYGTFSVNDFARNHFDGGGHLNAAGGTSTLSMDETVTKFVQSLEKYKNELETV